MSRPLIVSCYTANDDYPAHAERLRGECAALGLASHIFEQPDTGTYLGNCLYKPGVISDRLHAWGGPVWWVDVDASILQPPRSFAGCDVAAHPMPATRDRTWHVGSLYFAFTHRASAILSAWSEALDSEHSDEWALDRVWRDIEASWGVLPHTYCHLPRHGPVTEETVIMHRLSRTPYKSAFQARRV